MLFAVIGGILLAKGSYVGGGVLVVFAIIAAVGDTKTRTAAGYSAIRAAVTRYFLGVEIAAILLVVLIGLVLGDLALVRALKRRK